MLSNRPFPRSLNPLFQSQAKCEVFLIHIEIRTNYPNKKNRNWTLKNRLGGTRNWKSCAWANETSEMKFLLDVALERRTKTSIPEISAGESLIL